MREPCLMLTAIGAGEEKPVVSALPQRLDLCPWQWFGRGPPSSSGALEGMELSRSFLPPVERSHMRIEFSLSIWIRGLGGLSPLPPSP